MSAAGYYIYTHQRSAKAQALMISVRVRGEAQGLVLEVRNNSGAPIYNVEATFYRRKLKDIVTDPGIGTPLESGLPDILKDWEGSLTFVPLYLDQNVVQAGETFTKTVPELALSMHHECSLTFMDSNSIHWSMKVPPYTEKERYKLKKVKYFGGVYKRDDMWRMSFTEWVKYRKRRMKLARWAKSSTK